MAPCGSRIGIVVTSLVWLAVGIGGCAEDRIVETYHDALDASTIEVLDLSVEAGDLVVTGDADTDQIGVDVDLTTDRVNEDKDGEARHAMHLELRDMGDGTALLTVWFDPDMPRYAGDVTVTIPQRLELIASDDSGDTLIERCASVDLEDGSGDVEIKGIAGQVVVDDGSGELTIDDVTGDVEVADGAGDLRVENIEGDVDIDDGSGDITVAHVTGDVTIVDGSGQLDVEDVGSLSAK